MTVAETRPGHCWRCDAEYLRPAGEGGTLLKGRAVVLTDDGAVVLRCEHCRAQNRFRPVFLRRDRSEG